MDSSRGPPPGPPEALPLLWKLEVPLWPASEATDPELRVFAPQVSAAAILKRLRSTQSELWELERPACQSQPPSPAYSPLVANRTEISLQANKSQGLLLKSAVRKGGGLYAAQVNLVLLSPG